MTFSCFCNLEYLWCQCAFSIAPHATLYATRFVLCGKLQGFFVVCRWGEMAICFRHVKFAQTRKKYGRSVLNRERKSLTTRFTPRLNSSRTHQSANRTSTRWAGSTVDPVAAQYGTLNLCCLFRANISLCLQYIGVIEVTQYFNASLHFVYWFPHYRMFFKESDLYELIADSKSRPSTS